MFHRRARIDSSTHSSGRTRTSSYWSCPMAVTGRAALTPSDDYRIFLCAICRDVNHRIAMLWSQATHKQPIQLPMDRNNLFKAPTFLTRTKTMNTQFTSRPEPWVPPHPFPLPLRGGEGARRAGEGFHGRHSLIQSHANLLPPEGENRLPLKSWPEPRMSFGSTWIGAWAFSSVFVLIASLVNIARADALAEPNTIIKVQPVVPLALHAFPLTDIRLSDGPFKHAMELDEKYLLSLDEIGRASCRE